VHTGSLQIIPFLNDFILHNLGESPINLADVIVNIVLDVLKVRSDGGPYTCIAEASLMGTNKKLNYVPIMPSIAVMAGPIRVRVVLRSLYWFANAKGRHKNTSFQKKENHTHFDKVHVCNKLDVCGKESILIIHQVCQIGDTLLRLDRPVGEYTLVKDVNETCRCLELSRNDHDDGCCDPSEENTDVEKSILHQQ
jgi:hypothetical protein